MPQPTRSDVHVNRALTMISIAYIQDRKDFIASDMFPIIPVQKQSDLYFTYTKDFWFRTGSQKRAPATQSAGVGYGLNANSSYSADVWAVHYDVADQIRQNADLPLNMDRDATIFVTQQQLLRREITFSTKYLTTGVWTGSSTGSDITPSPKWDTATGLPINDIDTQKRAVKSQTGFLPNFVEMADDTFFAVKNNPSVIDRIKYTQRGVVTEDLMAALLQVDKFLISQAVLNSAAEGAAGSFGFLTSASCLVGYAAKNPGIMMPSGGYTFGWTGLVGSGAAGEGRIKSFRMEEIAADRVEGEMAYDQKLVGADLGAFFTACITP